MAVEEKTGLGYQDKLAELIKGGGVFVTTRCGLFRANKRLEADEMGLDEIPEEVRKHIKPASIKLLPDEICEEMKLLRSIENRLNGLVNNMTFEFEGFGRYLTNNQTQEFADELEELKQEFFGVVTVFEQNYYDYIERSVALWQENAHTLLPRAIRDNEEQVEIYRNRLARSVRDAFPAVTTIRDKFRFVATYLRMPDPASEAWSNAQTEVEAMSEEFLQLTMQQLRYEAFEAINAMATSINEDKWSQKTLNKLPKLVERIKGMQLVEDNKLTEYIENFSKEFITMEAKDFKKEQNQEAFDKMKEGLSGAVDELRELAEADLRKQMEAKVKGGGGRKIKAKPQPF